MALFGTQEWATKFAEALNSSEKYAEAAADLQGDFYFVVNASENVPQEVTMYVNLANGKCTEAVLVENPESRSPEFVMKGALESWRAIIVGELDPRQAIMTGKLNLKGNMAKLMKNLAAANELVTTLSAVETQFA